MKVNYKNITKIIEEILDKLSSTNVLKSINRINAFRGRLLDDYENFQNLKLYLYLTGLSEANYVIFKEASSEFKYSKSNNALNKTLPEYFKYLDGEFSNSEISFSLNMNNHSDYFSGPLYFNLSEIIDFILTHDNFKNYLIHTSNISEDFNFMGDNKNIGYDGYAAFIKKKSMVLSVENYLNDGQLAKEYFNDLLSYKNISLTFEYSKVNIFNGRDYYGASFSNTLSSTFMPPHLLEVLRKIEDKDFVKKISLGEDLPSNSTSGKRINEDDPISSNYFYLLDYFCYYCLKFNLPFRRLYGELISPVVGETLKTSKATKKFYNFITIVFKEYDEKIPIEWQWELALK